MALRQFGSSLSHWSRTFQPPTNHSRKLVKTSSRARKGTRPPNPNLWEIVHPTALFFALFALVTVVVGCLAISAIYSRSESIQKVKSWEKNMQHCFSGRWEVVCGRLQLAQIQVVKKWRTKSVYLTANSKSWTWFSGLPSTCTWPARHCCEMLLHLAKLWSFNTKT